MVDKNEFTVELEMQTQSEEITKTVQSLPSPIRIDTYCAQEFPELSRSRIKEMLKAGEITCNGKSAKPSLKVQNGDSIYLKIDPPKEIEAKAQNLPIEIVYEDEDVCVVNKEQGMVVHPASGSPDHTLVNALLYHLKDLSGIGGELRPGIVHRIDKDTSGLLVIAKNDLAHQKLSEQFKVHSITREYIALVKGFVKEDVGSIDLPIGRDPKDRKKMAVTDKNAKEAITHFEVLSRFKEGYTLCQFHLETGRTHQIRVHMKSLGHPLAGDPVYGGDKKNPFKTNGQMLHARKLGFIHPRSGEYMEFQVEPPDLFAKTISHLTPVDS